MMIATSTTTTTGRAVVMMRLETNADTPFPCGNTLTDGPIWDNRAGTQEVRGFLRLLGAGTFVVKLAVRARRSSKIF